MPKNQDFVYKIMKKSDCLLHPSVEEGIANVVLESMAIGLPIISSNCGGMPEVIRDNQNGLIFEKRNVESLESQILKLYNIGPKKRELMA